MHLKITNLFGYRNYDLELNDKINILIGENGSGKSTILKILDHLIKNDFEKLSKIPFENIYIKFPINDVRYEVIDGKKKELNFIEIKLNSSDIKQLDFTKDAKFRIIFKKYLEEYNYENDYNNETFNFDEFVNGLKKKVEEEKTGVQISQDEEYLEYDMKYYYDISVKLKDEDEYYDNDTDYNRYTFVVKNNKLNFSSLLTFYPIDAYFFWEFIDRKITYGSRMYLFYFYYYNLIKYISKELFINNFNVINCHEEKQYTSIVDFLLPYKRHQWTDLLNSNVLSNGYYLEKNKDVCTQFIESKTSDKEVNKKIKLIYHSFNKELHLLSRLLEYSADYSDYVTLKEKKKYDTMLMTKESFIKLIKDIGNVNLIDMDDEDYEDIDQSSEKYKKYLLLMSIIKKHKNKYSFPDEEKTNEKELFSFWNLEEITPAYIERLEEAKYTREDFILNLSDNPTEKIRTTEKRVMTEEDVINGTVRQVFNFYKIFSNINTLDLSSYFDSSEAKNFKILFDKYLINKSYQCLYNDHGELIIKLKDKKTGLPIEEFMLSSGEYKIYRLIKEMTLDNEKKVKLIDEPELSFSLYWQNMLVDDLMNYTNADKIIIATQSTNLIKEDQIKYLVEVKYSE